MSANMFGKPIKILLIYLNYLCLFKKKLLVLLEASCKNNQNQDKIFHSKWHIIIISSLQTNAIREKLIFFILYDQFIFFLVWLAWCRFHWFTVQMVKFATLASVHSIAYGFWFQCFYIYGQRSLFINIYNYQRMQTNHILWFWWAMYEIFLVWLFVSWQSEWTCIIARESSIFSKSSPFSIKR